MENKTYSTANKHMLISYVNTCNDVYVTIAGDGYQVIATTKEFAVAMIERTFEEDINATIEIHTQYTQLSKHTDHRVVVIAQVNLK